MNYYKVMEGRLSEIGWTTVTTDVMDVAHNTRGKLRELMYV